VYLVAHGVVNVILQSIPILEYALTQVAVVGVLGRGSLDVAEECCLGTELVRADTAPVFVGVIRDGAAFLCGIQHFSLLLAGTDKGRLGRATDDERRWLRS